MAFFYLVTKTYGDNSGNIQAHLL